MDLRLIFWETTRGCNLKCPHCRAQAQPNRLPGELTTEEAKNFIDELATFSKPILVFSGGEPLLREDIFTLSHYAAQIGLKTAIATNATLITKEIAQKLKEGSVQLVAVSVYGASAKTHDDFCGKQGAFTKTLAGIRNLKETGVDLQINTTITKKNLNELEAMGDFAFRLGAISFHPFFLVPTGRAKALEGDEIFAWEYEEAFNRLYDLQRTLPLHIKATCAPHYYRFLSQCNANDELISKGCLAGQGVCFISYKGEVFGCGYLPIAAGDLRKQNFKSIWFESELFRSLRDESKLKGKCGVCEFNKVCGGCRARAYAESGDYLAEETECVYQPLSVKS